MHVFVLLGRPRGDLKAAYSLLRETFAFESRGLFMGDLVVALNRAPTADEAEVIGLIELR